MPELPEVEVLTQSLISVLDLPQKIKGVDFLRENIRNTLPVGKRKWISGETLLGLERRAKYILFETEDHYLISHLGMTGNWRLQPRLDTSEAEKHDHVQVKFKNGDMLIFQDARRFGVFDIIKKTELATDKRFTLLGPEPFSPAFNFKYLFQLSRTKKVPIKSFIMDQRVVVGVGNIYASEVLHAIGLSPLVQAGRVSAEKYKLMVEQIRKTLRRAIKKGGSSIKDFKEVNGNSGYFQNEFAVYGRDGEPCRKCGTVIKSKVISGRNTFWCVKCQNAR
jgi:formamidopyrimidine-DNA glycosylase